MQLIKHEVVSACIQNKHNLVAIFVHSARELLSKLFVDIYRSIIHRIVVFMKVEKYGIQCPFGLTLLARHIMLASTLRWVRSIGSGSSPFR